MADDKTKKLIIHAAIAPAQQRITLAAQHHTPVVAGKPGIFIGFASQAGQARGESETPDPITNTVWVGEGMFVLTAAINGHVARGNWCRANRTTQTILLFLSGTGLPFC